MCTSNIRIFEQNIINEKYKNVLNAINFFFDLRNESGIENHNKFLLKLKIMR